MHVHILIKIISKVKLRVCDKVNMNIKHMSTINKMSVSDVLAFVSGSV